MVFKTWFLNLTIEFTLVYNSSDNYFKLCLLYSGKTNCKFVGDVDKNLCCSGTIPITKITEEMFINNQ